MNSVIKRPHCFECGVVLTDDEQAKETGLCDDCETFIDRPNAEEYGIYEVDLGEDFYDE